MVGTLRSFKIPRAAVAAVRDLAVIAGLAAGLGGCAVAVGAGAAGGVAALQERGIEGAAKDFKVEALIMEQWINFDLDLPVKVGVEVYEGRVLLTGAVADPQLRADAVRLAWKVIGVKDVLNEIQVTGDSGIIDFARDSWITAQLKTKLTFDEEVMAINYAIETVNGIIYLIGIAQNQKELDRVIAQGRNIPYVRDIISHVRVKSPGSKEGK